MKRSQGPTGKGAPLPLQCQAFSQAQRGAKTRIGRERGQAYNHTTKEAEASEQVVAGKILLHSNPSLTLVHCIALYQVNFLHCIVYPLCVWMTNGKFVKSRVMWQEVGSKYSRIRNWRIWCDPRNDLAQQAPNSDRLLKQESNLQNPTPVRISIQRRVQVLREKETNRSCHWKSQGNEDTCVG